MDPAGPLRARLTSSDSNNLKRPHGNNPSAFFGGFLPGDSFASDIGWRSPLVRPLLLRNRLSRGLSALSLLGLPSLAPVTVLWLSEPHPQSARASLLP